jgi:hypothetical protein
LSRISSETYIIDSGYIKITRIIHLNLNGKLAPIIVSNIDSGNCYMNSDSSIYTKYRRNKLVGVCQWTRAQFLSLTSFLPLSWSTCLYESGLRHKPQWVPPTQWLMGYSASWLAIWIYVLFYKHSNSM